jgi:hypothetical protein
MTISFSFPRSGVSSVSPCQWASKPPIPQGTMRAASPLRTRGSAVLRREQ